MEHLGYGIDYINYSFGCIDFVNTLCDGKYTMHGAYWCIWDMNNTSCPGKSPALQLRSAEASLRQPQRKESPAGASVTGRAKTLAEGWKFCGRGGLWSPKNDRVQLVYSHEYPSIWWDLTIAQSEFQDPYMWSCASATFLVHILEVYPLT